MPIYKITRNKLDKINEKNFKKEENLQIITEENLEKLFNLQFVSGKLNKQLRVQNFEIDTLAFDKNTSSFVIVEYKKDRSISVIDQGFNYLALLLNNKADFILEYQDKTGKRLNKEDIDWSQSRVLFVSPSFTSHQKGAIAFKDLQIELWEVSLYENSTMSFIQHKPSETDESINKVSKNPTVAKVTRELKTYTLDDHFKKGWENSRSIFSALEEQVLNLYPKLEVKPVKYYIGFQDNGSIVFEVQSMKSKIRVGLLRVQPKDLRDPENKTIYRKNSFKYYNKHITDLSIDSENDIPYALMLIKQVYEKHFR